MDEERNYETEAEEQGWNPNFDGPNKVDAQTFVERGEKIAGILKSRVDKQDVEITRLKEANKQFGEYHKQTLEKQHQESEKQIHTLQAEVAQAITDGDGAAYTRASQEIDTLKAASVPVNDQDAWAQMSQQWVGDNQWYNTNDKLGRYADGVAEQVIADGYQGAAYFSELTKRVQEEFPDEFKNPNKTKANAVEASGELSTTTSKDRNYKNLPADAKRACDDFVAQGFMTRDAYVEQFEFED
jgi:hypothetical protein